MRNPAKLRATEVRHAPVPLAECALARAVAVIGDAWILLILREAVYGITRFEEMRADLAIPRTVLSDRLNRLVGAGLLRRVPYQQPGQRTRQAYELTDGGRALMPAVVALWEWAEGHLPGGRSPLRLRHRDCGADVRARLVCGHGHVLADAVEVAATVERPAGP
jgi:DNA-binding HxlR family transcriptional regulator